jgi:ADP-heptose:LPS heptosyltransferase
MNKILVIRFSSFGDIVQAMSVAKLIKEEYPQSQLDWLTKTEFSNLASCCCYVDNVISFNKKDGIIGLIKLSFGLRKNNYDVVYDAHSNLRSLIIKLILKTLNFNVKIITRAKERWNRVLLFNFRKNNFPSPYRGMKSYCAPLNLSNYKNINLKQDWNFKKETIEKVKSKCKFLDQTFILMAPSAAWKMKRWPKEHWKKLKNELKDYSIVFIGGPTDEFISTIVETSDFNCLNLSGKLNLIESSYLVSQAKVVISADTGIIHVADLLGVAGISLIGPTAFGFSTNDNIKTLEVDLACRPCSKDGRGKCDQEIYQECMVKITVEKVKEAVLSLISN